jgi:hypothetical protein
MEERSRRGRYLDVSEYILKEYSPMSSAMNADFRLSERVRPFAYESTGSIACSISPSLVFWLLVELFRV